jgi:hypothetical protein
MSVRMHLERGVREVHPTIARRPTGHGRDAAISYRLRVDVPEYEARNIELLLSRTSTIPRVLAVYADGPDQSPHRWPPRSRDRKKRRPLCIWHPDDPTDRRWNPQDGLLSLIALTQVHLFKEAYFREFGEWLGDELPHATDRRTDR